MMKLSLAAIGAIAASSGLFASAPAIADSAWEYRLTPYVWLPGMEIETSINRGGSLESQSSILDVLEFAALVTGEARKDEYTILGEFNYLNLGQTVQGPFGLTRADLDLDGSMASLAGGYAFYETDTTRVEGLLGARLWSVEVSADFARLPTASTDETWIDPIIGARASFALSEKVSALVMADIGGGVGADIQAEALGRIGYAFSNTITGAIGWRHYYTEVSRGGLDMDLTLTGPFLALDINF